MPSYYTFKSLDRHAGHIPSETCPQINEAIDILENLRKENASLRSAAEYWKQVCEDVCDERDALDDKLDDALNQIKDLQSELQTKL